MKSQEWNDYLFILPFFISSETVQYIIGFIVELFLDLSCVNACLIAFLTAVLACIQIIGMHWGYIFLLCTSSPPQAYVWYKIHSITLHCVYMLFHINTKCQNKKCILWATVQWPISFFTHPNCTKHSSFCVPPLLCTPTEHWLTWCQWVDVLWRSLICNASPECYILCREVPHHQTCRFSLFDTLWHVTLGSSSCSISLACCAAFREASHHHTRQSSLLAPVWHITFCSSSCSISLACCAAFRETSHRQTCQSSHLDTLCHVNLGRCDVWSPIVRTIACCMHAMRSQSRIASLCCVALTNVPPAHNTCCHPCGDPSQPASN